MGRIKPAWYYEKQATEAKAREDYYRNRTPTDSTTVNKRSRRKLFYNSLHLKTGTNPAIFEVYASENALQLVNAEEAGLLESLPDGRFSIPVRGSGIRPSMIYWYQGATTATAKKTAWGTRWIQYYNSTGDQSHYSLPFSRTTGGVTVTTLRDAFGNLFGQGGSKRTLLGTDNGRAWLELEHVPTSYDS